MWKPPGTAAPQVPRAEWVFPPLPSVPRSRQTPQHRQVRKPRWTKCPRHGKTQCPERAAGQPARPLLESPWPPFPTIRAAPRAEM